MHQSFSSMYHHQVQNVCETLSVLASSFTIWSSASFFSRSCSKLRHRISRWSGLDFLLRLFTIWGEGGGGSCSHASSVCRFIRCICLFKLSWSGCPTASQYCSHNQSSHPKICYIPFISKPVSHLVVRHHIQYESKKSASQPQKGILKQSKQKQTDNVVQNSRG